MAGLFKSNSPEWPTFGRFVNTWNGDNMSANVIAQKEISK